MEGYLADEGDEMMFAEGVDFNVLNNDHFVVALVE